MEPAAPGDSILWRDGARVVRRGCVVAVVPPGFSPAAFLPPQVGKRRIRFRRHLDQRQAAHVLVEVQRGGERELLSWFYLPDMRRLLKSGDKKMQQQKAEKPKSRMMRERPSAKARKALDQVNKALEAKGLDVRVSIGKDLEAPTQGDQLRMDWAPPKKAPKRRVNHSWLWSQVDQVDRCILCGFQRKLRGSVFVFRATSDTDWAKYRVKCSPGKPAHV